MTAPPSRVEVEVDIDTHIVVLSSRRDRGEALTVNLERLRASWGMSSTFDALEAAVLSALASLDGGPDE